jgi:hypothetical protein
MFFVLFAAGAGWVCPNESVPDANTSADNSHFIIKLIFMFLPTQNYPVQIL